MPLRGDIRSVPGARRRGRLAGPARTLRPRCPLERVLAPAIELAEDGFPASIMLAFATHLVHDAARCAASSAPTARSRSAPPCACPGIARTLRAVARRGPRRLLRRRVRARPARAGRGPLLGGTTSRRARRSGARRCGSPVWGHELWTVPPPSQGYLTLAGAAVAERAGLGADPDRPGVGPPARRGVARRRPRPSRRALRRGRRRRPAGRGAPGAGGGAGARPIAAAPADVAHRSASTVRTGVARIGDGDTTHLCALRRRRARRVADAVQRARLRLASRRAGDRRVPAQPRRRASRSSRATRPRCGPGRRPPHTLSPMLVTAAGRRAHASRRRHGRRRPAADHQPAAGAAPAHAARTRPRAISAPRLALDAPVRRPVPALVGRRPHGPGRGRRAGGVARRASRPAATGPAAISAFDPVAVGCAQIIAVERNRPAESGGLVAASDPRSPEGAAVGR